MPATIRMMFATALVLLFLPANLARDRSLRTREIPEARAAARRVLIPVDATERSRWAA